MPSNQMDVMMKNYGAPPIDEARAAENFMHLNNDALELKITQLTTDINASTCKQVLLMAELLGADGREVVF